MQKDVFSIFMNLAVLKFFSLSPIPALLFSPGKSKSGYKCREQHDEACFLFSSYKVTLNQ